MEEVDYSKCNLVVYSEMVNDVPHLISLKKQNGKVVADTLFTYSEQNPLAKEVMSSVISQTINYFPADSYGFVFLLIVLHGYRLPMMRILVQSGIIVKLR